MADKKGNGTLMLVGALGVGAALLFTGKSHAETKTSTTVPFPDGSTPDDVVVPDSQQSATDSMTDEEKIDAAQSGSSGDAVLAYNAPKGDGEELPEELTPKAEQDIVDKGDITEDMVVKHPALVKKVLESNTKKHQSKTLKHAAIAVGAGVAASGAAAIILNNSKKQKTSGQKAAIILGAGVAATAVVAALELAVHRKKKAARKVTFVVNKAALEKSVVAAGGTASVVQTAQETGKPTAATQALKILASPAAKKQKVKAGKKKKLVKKPVAVAKKKPAGSISSSGKKKIIHKSKKKPHA